MTARSIKGGLLAVLGAVALGCGQEAAGPSGGRVLLEDAYSPTGSLIVAEGDDGLLNVLLRGKIGVEAPEIARAIELDDREVGGVRGVCVEIYRAAHASPR